MLIAPGLLHALSGPRSDIWGLRTHHVAYGCGHGQAREEDCL